MSLRRWRLLRRHRLRCHLHLRHRHHHCCRCRGGGWRAVRVSIDSELEVRGAAGLRVVTSEEPPHAARSIQRPHPLQHLHHSVFVENRTAGGERDCLARSEQARRLLSRQELGHREAAVAHALRTVPLFHAAWGRHKDEGSASSRQVPLPDVRKQAHHAVLVREPRPPPLLAVVYGQIRLRLHPARRRERGALPFDAARARTALEEETLANRTRCLPLSEHMTAQPL